MQQHQTFESATVLFAVLKMVVKVSCRSALQDHDGSTQRQERRFQACFQPQFQRDQLCADA